MRAAMVGFPSTLPPRTYTPAGAASSATDERFVMGSSHAGRILRRLRPPSPPDLLWPSTTGPPDPSQTLVWSTAPIVAADEAPEPHETPIGARLLSWGTRRKVRYLDRGHMYKDAPLPLSPEPTYIEFHPEAPSEPSSSIAEGEEAEEERIDGRMSSPRGEKSKGGRRESRKKPRAGEKKKVKVEGVEEKKGSGSKVERWSAERYVAAEMKLVEVMREVGAGLGSPVLRLRLRDEARKHIGDTGLLDHLLKHMVGKVVTGGGERFRRQHNVAGELEYWLEPAELAEIRCRAGVADSYWVPPPGWKLGDPTSACPCSAECQQ